MLTFRTQNKFFIRKAAAVAILTILALLLNSRYPSFALWFLYLMLVLFCCGGLTSLLRTHLKLDETTLQGWTGGEDVYLSWADLHYARREQEKPGKYWLVLGTKDRTYAHTLELLDAEAVWREVQRRVSPEALAEDAADRLVKIQEQAWEQRVGALKGPFTLLVGRRFIWLLLLGVLGWGVSGLLVPLFPETAISVALLICVSICILLTLAFFLALAHTLHIDEHHLTMRTFRGYFRIAWDEIEVVRADPGNTVVIFEGNGKRLVTAPYVLGGFQKDSAMEYITLRLRQKQISVTREARLLVLPVASSKSAKVKL